MITNNNRSISGCLAFFTCFLKANTDYGIAMDVEFSVYNSNCRSVALSSICWRAQLIIILMGRERKVAVPET